MKEAIAILTGGGTAYTIRRAVKSLAQITNIYNSTQ